MENASDKNKKGGMGSRGVTRPMAEMEMQKHQQSMKDDGEMKPMDKDQKMKMLQMHHMQTLWVYWMIIILGVWILLAPLTFSYGKNPVEPSGGRELWLTLTQRINFMKWSDMISGILLIFFGWRSLTVNRPVSMWIACFIGIWLSFAPLIFWAPNAAAYVNDSLTGALIISLTVLIPGMPNMILYMEQGPEIPKGWSYNPSSWPQRWIMIITGFAGWMVSRFLGAFQLGYIETVWDPFFGNSSMQVLNSDMSHSFPVSDGGFGALAYTFEFLMGWMGGTSRWRTMPWMVTVFGILVIPLGLVHIFLVISQPVVVGHWCTFCLLAAAIMLPMIPLEVDEVIAMGQFLVQSKRKGSNMWKIFWKGGTAEGEGMDKRSPKLMELPQKGGSVLKASLWGMSVPRGLLISALLGIYTMFSPAVFGLPIKTPLSNISHLAGALIVVVSVICMGEVLRRGRYLNMIIALVLIAGPWIVDYRLVAFNVNELIIGILVIIFSIARGPKKETYGLWDKYVK